jgi:hypothetical protein
MTLPTPPHDLSEHDRAGIAGTIHTPDPAAVERLRALMAQQRPPRWQEARATPVQRQSALCRHLRQAAHTPNVSMRRDARR